MNALYAVAPSLCLLAACASPPAMQQSTLPESIRVNPPDKLVMSTTGVGEITYECRAKKDAAGQFEWAFAGPSAVLYDQRRQVVGKYYGGPTWESVDGSKVTGSQVAVSPAPAGNIPLQLVKANSLSGAGKMAGISFIQRVNTKGGVAPATPCTSASLGQKQQVAYEADYLFYAR
ncbi:DUF3455 domain-containing protein [Jeongeupia sp. USM3]|uniref:DUF3455 domain-containing protein n=1 Tax=Jeongeupia sp. USM3 TaxID=1906741 RepID=UPI00089DFBBB|nr:DUF3455 domain-containing protein [Jeongeupia sp. USM3]AOY02158.1 hypothetical protein BJP62_01740 [Jeongeupia sp. USM3]